ncbi:ABC transporter ATP-binding protein [Gulosibacter massiliensis]|uniref:ABC transporter ATP-binding protein n=1 Tax=Gulosibacter massiliensis TaxID=2479839 RepID=UPI000F6391B1|nr:ABC transporter ATP-binding protein [Gulosibacter massiliensis]
MAAVTFASVSRRFPGATRNAVDDLSIEIADGEFLVLVGPSGCGKTTTLRMLAGLDPVDDGRILIGDDEVTNVAPKDRDIAMVFQNYALYPHLTVEQNMGFGLKTRGVSKAERNEKVREAAKLLDLEPLLHRRPSELSGGQRQRVAMGRAIVREPQVFLMDEPLSNLDAKLRVQTRAQIASLQRRLGTTTVYVTHDQTEAMTMGTRIAVLNEGKLQQLGTPQELYDRPVNEFVASFIGTPAMNLWTENGERVGIRAEDLRLTNEGGIPARVTLVEELGSDGYLFCSGEIAGEEIQLVARVDGRDHPQIGDEVRLEANRQRLHRFRLDDGTRLN